MWRGFDRAYDCQPEKAVSLAVQIWALDTYRDFRVNAITYEVLEALQWTPLENNWRLWFRGTYGLTPVVVIPPEDSYYTLNVTLWTQIYDMMDAGHFPDQDSCWLLKFPASQGGSWPVLWP